MAYKVQTNKVKAFIIQDLTALIVTLLFVGLCVFMTYVNIVNAGESCTKDAGLIMKTCSPVLAYAFFGPVAILGAALFIRFIYNLFKIGTISPIYLKYRNFSGDKVSVEKTANAVTPTVEEKKMTEFPYGKFIKLNIYYMLSAALVLAFLPVPSWVNVFVVYAIALFANVFSLSFMSLDRVWAIFRHVFNRNKQPNVAIGSNDPRSLKFFELRADLSKSRLKMLGILVLMMIAAMFLSAISVGIKESIYK